MRPKSLSEDRDLGSWNLKVRCRGLKKSKFSNATCSQLIPRVALSFRACCLSSGLRALSTLSSLQLIHTFAALRNSITTTSTQSRSTSTSRLICRAGTMLESASQKSNRAMAPPMAPAKALRASLKTTTISNDTYLQRSAHYFSSGKYSDVTIACGPRKWKVHRLQLSQHSAVFEAMLQGHFKVCTSIAWATSLFLNNNAVGRQAN